MPLCHLTQALSSAAKGWVTLSCILARATLSQFAREKEERANILEAGSSSLPALAALQEQEAHCAVCTHLQLQKPLSIPSLSQWLSQPTGTRQNFSDDSEKLRKGLRLYIYYKCLFLHTFTPSAKGIM